MEVRLSNLRGSYDLIVIGSGPAGLTLALRYDALTNGRTLIVESGYRTILNSEAQKLAVIEASGDISSAHSRHNQRVFGGTSIIWNGLCAVLEKRAFLNEEWPFTYDELSGWYPEAAKILSVPEEVHISPEKPFPDNPNIVYKPYYFSPPTRFHVLFDDWVTQSTTVDVLFNHTVTNINIKDDVALSVLVQRSSNKRTAPVEVFGSKIVLATGGIQNARLLQLSLPKSNDLPVGQYFCEHPHLRGYSHLILDEEKFRQLIFQTPSRLKILHAIALSSEFSNAHQLPSATFFLPPPPLPSVTRKNILGRNRKALTMQTDVSTEMLPLQKNRITLSDSRRDILGQPIAHVALKFNTQEISAAFKHLNAELIHSGLGRMSPPAKEQKIRGGGHLMASTRMGKDPKLSVTNAHGQVHGVDNLYIAGSSLFPSVGSANPTLTIVALSLRLATHLAGK